MSSAPPPELPEQPPAPRRWVNPAVVTAYAVVALLVGALFSNQAAGTTMRSLSPECITNVDPFAVANPLGVVAAPDCYAGQPMAVTLAWAISAAIYGAAAMGMLYLLGRARCFGHRPSALMRTGGGAIAGLAGIFAAAWVAFFADVIPAGVGERLSGRTLLAALVGLLVALSPLVLGLVWTRPGHAGHTPSTAKTLAGVAVLILSLPLALLGTGALSGGPEGPPPEARFTYGVWVCGEYLAGTGGEIILELPSDEFPEGTGGGVLLNDWAATVALPEGAGPATLTDLLENPGGWTCPSADGDVPARGVLVRWSGAGGEGLVTDLSFGNTRWEELQGDEGFITFGLVPAGETPAIPQPPG